MQASNNHIDSTEMHRSVKMTHQDSYHYASHHFDNRIDELLQICESLITNYGVFHLTIHFSSSQLVCWTFDNPYSYQIYQAEDIFADHFLRLFAPLQLRKKTCIELEKLKNIFQSFKYLRESSYGSQLRNASIHVLNGYIGLTYDGDDTRYIESSSL